MASPSPLRQRQQDEGKKSPQRTEPQDEGAAAMTLEQAQDALKKLKRLTKPDQKEHDEKVTLLNEDIKAIKQKVEEVKMTIDEASSARGGQRDELSDAREKMKALMARRDAIRGELDRINADKAAAKDKVDRHTRSKKDLLNEVKYESAEDIDRAVAERERRQQTQSMSLGEEKKLIKEVEQLKQVKKLVSQFAEKDEHIKLAQDVHTTLRSRESEKKAELRAVNEEAAAQYAILEELNKAKEEEGNPIAELVKRKGILRDEQTAKIQEIKALREDFKQQLDRYFDFLREQRRLKQIIKKADIDARRAAEDERRRLRDEEEAKKIPYEEEMALCDMLVAYLQNNFLKEEMKKVAQEQAAAEAAAVGSTAPDLAASLSAEFNGQVLVVKKREDEDYFMAGLGGKKKKKEGVKTGGKKGKKDIVHALDTVESFSILSLTPPSTHADVAKCIEDIKAKKEWFSKQPKGAVKALLTTGDESRGSANAGDGADGGAKKGKKAGKEVAPEMTDEMFPSLPAKAPAEAPSSDEPGEQGEAAHGEEDGVEATGEEKEADQAIEEDTAEA